MRHRFVLAISLSLAAAASPGVATANPGTAPMGQQAIAQVIQRALSQQGVPYVYGGGDVTGPTNGVRPGTVTVPGTTGLPGTATVPGTTGLPGTATVPGTTGLPGTATVPGTTGLPGTATVPGTTGLPGTVVGFDSSGLIQYAFAGAGIKMPRTSGEQCNVGRKVALAQARPGDLMCYGPGGSQSVALYLGNGQMIEGTEPSVTVSPARTSNMVPFLTRIIES